MWLYTSVIPACLYRNGGVHTGEMAGSLWTAPVVWSTAAEIRETLFQQGGKQELTPGCCPPNTGVHMCSHKHTSTQKWHVYKRWKLKFRICKIASVAYVVGNQELIHGQSVKIRTTFFGKIWWDISEDLKYILLEQSLIAYSVLIAGCKMINQSHIELYTYCFSQA